MLVKKESPLIGYGDGNTSSAFAEMVQPINDYLIKFRDIVPEYAVIREMVEQKSELVEENINLTLFSPLYIGLMGTIVGIVFGVAGIVFKGGLNADINNGSLQINDLLIGVGVAMLASFIGLFLSLYNSTVKYKAARKAHYKDKFNFLNFIQINIISSYQYRDTSSISSLHTVINRFSESLAEKLDRLGNFYENNTKNILAQEKLFEKIDKLNITAIAQVLEEFGKSADSLNLLNESLKGVGEFVQESRKLTDGVNSLFERFKIFENSASEFADNIKAIANEINEKINISSKLFEFIESQFEEFDKKQSAFSSAVDKIENYITHTFDNLSLSTQSKSTKLGEEINLVDKSFNKAVENLEHRTENLVSSFEAHLDELNDQMARQLTNVEESLKQQFDKLKVNTETQANFIATGHETILKKFDIQLQSLTDSVSQKVQDISRIAQKQTEEMTQTINGNRELFSNLENLVNIRQKLTEGVQNQQQIVEQLQRWEHHGFLQKVKRVYRKSGTVPKQKNGIQIFYMFLNKTENRKIQ